MTADLHPDVTAAVAQRLRAAAEAALPSAPERHPEPARDGQACLGALVDALRADPSTDLAWLLLTVLAGTFPVAADVRAVLRDVDLHDRVGLELSLLDRAHQVAFRTDTVAHEARVVTGVVVDVDASAKSRFHNGIQRTAREVVRAWTTDRDVTLAAWTWTLGTLRMLTPDEWALAARWDDAVEASDPTDDGGRDQHTAAEDDAVLVIPWHATLVLAEVPLGEHCEQLAALAELSGTAVVAIGYDAIPVISADLRPLGEPNGFASYLTVIKHVRRVAGISTSAATEFAGFGSALAAQGLPGPDVVEVMLPVTVPPAPEGYRRAAPARPQVLSVGRLEPHKNHGALLFAAERLWREGVEFDLHLVGGPGWDTTSVEAQLDRLREEGRPVRWSRSVGDEELWTLVRDASFTVFISLHEGFGLPVAESLACGTPVLTSSYGSQAEIAAAGGCRTVDPRDDEAVLDALREMVTDAGLRARLRDEAARIPAQTWQAYADALWSALVEEAA